jgi:D-beta-D-heptose 7-phosphate kinase/D-beta-D-heptose 1-phosphate adenosyltransferase
MSELSNFKKRHFREGLIVVFTNGCFDILHRGHIEYLKFCRSLGTSVIVGLNSDASVRKIKGEGRPINCQGDRKALLEALRYVDHVEVFDELTPLRLIKEVEPDILVKGEDWSDKAVVGRDFVEERGGRVVLAPFIAGKSTTAILNRCAE